MFDFFRRRLHAQPATDRPQAVPQDDRGYEPAPPDTAQPVAEPAYGGSGYYGSSDAGGQAFNGAQRLYPGDPGYREHPTRDIASTRIGAGGRLTRNGPKNYARADDRIRDDLCDRLAMNDALEVSEITVDVEQGIVKLGGTVGDRYTKRQIEEIAANTFGVDDVENDIHVASREDALRLAPSERVLNRS
nr:BON domain-containing protein [uncultured Cupriavidus sp.]